jgi:hypothetical protein
MAALSFSTSRAGDWIDRNVATVLGIKQSRAAANKEKGMSILTPRNREEEAVEIYYRNLISYTLENIKKRFESADGMPSFPDPVEIVCAGGTSMVGGFIEVFKQEYEAIKFPIPVKNIRRAEDPLFSVARGCLVAALSDI